MKRLPDEVGRSIIGYRAGMAARQGHPWDKIAKGEGYPVDLVRKWAAQRLMGMGKSYSNLKKPKRNSEMVRMRAEGKTFREIGHCFGISGARAKQIIDREMAR